LMTMAQEPQTADLHDDRKESVPSISSRIRISIVSTVRPGITLILYDLNSGFISGQAAS
jgi:hypothetical protein